MQQTFQVPISNRMVSNPLDNGNWNQEWQRFWPGFSAPAIITMTLAKVTPTGTDGSISINAFGLVTEIVEPT